MDKRSESVDSKIQKLDKELMRYTEQMKKMKPGPAKDAVKKRALAIMKQKRMYENQQSNLMNQQFNMEQQKFAMDGLKDTAATVSAMKDTNKAIKKQLKVTKISEVEGVMDDMEEMLEQAEEIQASLGRSYGLDDVDDDDLEAELAAMEDDPSLFFSAENESEGAADYLDLPATSTQPVEAAQAEEEAQPAKG